jgi:hypothetical protein
MKQSLVNQRLSKYTNKMLGFERYAKKYRSNSPQNTANFLTTFSPAAMSPADHVPLTEESLKKLQSPAGSTPVPPRDITPRQGSIAPSTTSNITSMNPPVPPSDGHGSIARKGSTSTLGLAEPSGKARSVDMNSVGTGVGGGVLRGGIRSSLDEPMSNKIKGEGISIFSFLIFLF